jgi:hypothetical protein
MAQNDFLNQSARQGFGLLVSIRSAMPRGCASEASKLMTAFWLIVGVIALTACFLGWYQERTQK